MDNAKRAANLWAEYEKCLAHERDWRECNFNDDNEDGVGEVGMRNAALQQLVKVQRAEAVAEEREACARIADDLEGLSRETDKGSSVGIGERSAARTLGRLIRDRSRPQESAPSKEGG